MANYRIQLVHDSDYQIDGATGWGEPMDSEYAAETRDKFENGMWDVYGIIVEMQCDMGGWHEIDSLWGSVADAGHFGIYNSADEIRDDYLRNTAHDMCFDATGVERP